jgi:hypothetical protein
VRLAASSAASAKADRNEQPIPDEKDGWAEAAFSSYLREF